MLTDAAKTPHQMPTAARTNNVPMIQNSPLIRAITAGEYAADVGQECAVCHRLAKTHDEILGAPGFRMLCDLRIIKGEPKDFSKAE